MECIFCRGTKNSRWKSHIIPESLGGRLSPISKPGVSCDECNQYFGQKVEALALRSFPFTGYRLLEGIPSKKGRYGSEITSLGTVRATGIAGRLELEPRTDGLDSDIALGQVSQLRLLAEVTEPFAVCRMLLKIGIELLGNHFHEVAISERVEAARRFARKPSRGDRWWFILRSDPSEMLGFAEPHEWSSEIIERDERLLAVMHCPGIATLVPLEDGTLPPDAAELDEPQYRVVWSEC